MKKLAIIGFLTLISQLSNLNAQIYDKNFREIQDVLARNSSIDINERKDVEGSQYIQDEYEPIKLDNIKANIEAKYNAYNGQMHIKIENETLSLNLMDDHEVNFTSLNKKYKTFSYNSVSKNSKRGFLVVIKETEKFKLLKEELIIFKEKVPGKNTYVREVPAKFIRSNDEYYIMLNEKIIYLPNKKNQLIKSFPKYSKKIKSYIKKNKLSTKKEEELIKIAEFIANISAEKKN